MLTSDIIRYRVYEVCDNRLMKGVSFMRDFSLIMCVCVQLIVEVSTVSPVSLGYCANSSLISQLLEELTGDDVLVR